MIEKLKIPEYSENGNVYTLHGDRVIYGKINEIIEEINRLKENECGCSNCTQWRLINAQSALKGMNK